QGPATPQLSSQDAFWGCVNCLAYDEAIMAQQDRIQQEIAVQNPLVSERLELAVLYKEYAEDDHIYQQKIKDLLQKYSYIRKTRPDGNCFYRAFGFAHLEALLEDGQELQRFALLLHSFARPFTASSCPRTMLTQPCTALAHHYAASSSPCTSLPQLCTASRRPCTASECPCTPPLPSRALRTPPHPLFPLQEVEPMCKESDHIHIIALARALHVSILVEYMDRGEGGATNPHVFPEGSQPRVCLLYRPGHYDILYK
uniref:ubiquitinyl hydrolase 1 n=1 Tax=Bubo bubo TaxID=30461 RepID=A0A8C0FXW0_BUBBB